MKRWVAVFELTATEQRIVIAILLALVAVALITSRQHARAKNILPRADLTQPSPNPGIRP